MTEAEKIYLLRSVLEDMVNGEQLLPKLRCQERSSGSICNQPATHFSTMGEMPGHVTVCGECAKFYRYRHVLKFPEHLAILVGNMRDQAREVLLLTGDK